ncbi:MAG: N-acetyltransferase [Deltaproteobacteria bacterium]|nr:N-acetyltransferase [Deltaproteobacteria bacterium]MBW1915498.1 N-acetyltransferase [Deltaproteobacteria bacterium]
MITKAVIQDVKQIHKLLGSEANKDILLQRSLSELYDHIRDYFVIRDKDKNDTIIAVCALGVCWEDLAEIRSLAVAKDFQKMGYGSRLVKKCFEEAMSLGIKKIFALTYTPGFFGKLGFQKVEKSKLPHKVWSDCLNCPKFPDCNEIAMEIRL